MADWAGRQGQSGCPLGSPPASLSLCSLRADNQAAVVLAVASCLGVVKDALEEMEQVTGVAPPPPA